MPLGQFGKAMAGEALQRAKSSMLDSVLPAEPNKAPAAVAATPESTGSLVLGQIQAMQRPLKADQELVVHCHAGGESLRVTEIFVPNPRVFVLSGHDHGQNVTRIIAPADTLQLVCKVMRVEAGNTPVRINVLTPRPKTDPPA